MNTETIHDILREMGSITKKTEYSVETMKVVIHYGLRIAEAYKRRLVDEEQRITKLNGVLNGNDK